MDIHTEITNLLQEAHDEHLTTSKTKAFSQDDYEKRIEMLKRANDELKSMVTSKPLSIDVIDELTNTYGYVIDESIAIEVLFKSINQDPYCLLLDKLLVPLAYCANFHGSMVTMPIFYKSLNAIVQCKNKYPDASNEITTICNAMASWLKRSSAIPNSSDWIVPWYKFISNLNEGYVFDMLPTEDTFMYWLWNVEKPDWLNDIVTDKLEFVVDTEELGVPNQNEIKTFSLFELLDRGIASHTNVILSERFNIVDTDDAIEYLESL